MGQHFPISGFKWLNQKEFNKLLINLTGYNFTDKNSPTGYILEVDLEYPDDLHCIMIIH